MREHEDKECAIGQAMINGEKWTQKEGEQKKQGMCHWKQEGDNKVNPGNQWRHLTVGCNADC